MKACIIYHSETGNTRHIAQHVASACDAQLIEVNDRHLYSRLTRFLVQCKMARGEELTEIGPATIDVTPYDLLVFGSPVWAFKPTPVIHTAITTLKGCEGKRALTFYTHGGRPGQTGETLRKWVDERGMLPVGCVGFHQNEIENKKLNQDLIARINSAMGT
jgi:multimeric flavodoxin WrbA